MRMKILENSSDENQIVSDQDATNKIDLASFDENMGAKSMSLDTLENEPLDFMMGEIDVKEQMDRAARAVDETFAGTPDAGDVDSPKSELGATFRATPGGLKEDLLGRRPAARI